MPQSPPSNAGTLCAQAAIWGLFPWVETPWPRPKVGTRRGRWTERSSGARVHHLPLPGTAFTGKRQSGESGLTSPDTHGGMGRNAQKSALNAFKRRASCNSRAIRPSQSGFGFTHNPWVVGSSPTRPTSALMLVHYTWPYLAGSRRRQTRSDRAYSARQVVKEWAQFLGRGGSLNPQTSPAQPSGRQEVALQ